MTRGHSLLELVLALVLFQVGLLAAAGLVHLAEVNFRRAELTVRATLEADWIGDSLLAQGALTPGATTTSWGQLQWSVLPFPVPALRIAAWSDVEEDTLLTLLALPPLKMSPPMTPVLPSPPGGDG